jgi:hypothetical protein
VTYREACVWDLSEAEAELNACYLLKVERGSIGRLRIDVPAELEPTRVTVRAADAAAAAPPVLRDWDLGPATDGFRPLDVHLAGPTDGRFVVNLECVPRRAATRQPVLRFPRLNTPAVKPVPNGIYYAFRADKVAVENRVPVGTVDLTPDDLLFHFGGVADLRLDAADTELKVFRPVTPATRAEFRPTLRPGPEAPSLTAETTWRLGLTRADADGTVRWQAAQPVPAAEFDLPEARLFGARVPRVVVAEVRGPDVAGWAQAGGRIQVWFRKPARDVTVEWVGRSAAFAGVPGGAGSVVFAAASPRPVGGRLTADTVRVRVDADSTARATRTDGWKAAAAGPGREWAFTTDHPAPAVLFDLFPPGITGPARGVGLVEVSDGAVTYRTVVEVPLRAGRPHRLSLVAGGLPPRATADLDLPPGVTVTEQRTTASARVWVLDVAPAPGAAFRAAVTIRYPAPDGPARLPAVTAGPVESGADPDGAIRWVGLVGHRPGASVRGASPAGLADVRPVWPGEADRLRLTGGSVWAVPPGSAPPVLVFDRPPPAAAPEAVSPPPHPPPASPATENASTGVPWPAAAWAVSAVVLFVLFVVRPRATWPEQLGLAAGLFGTAVAGGWWLGLGVEAAARLVWLARIVRHRLRPAAA